MEELSRNVPAFVGELPMNHTSKKAPSDPRADFVLFIVLAPENSVEARRGYGLFRGRRTNVAIVYVYRQSRHADFIPAQADHIWDGKWIFPVAWCLPCSHRGGGSRTASATDGERHCHMLTNAGSLELLPQQQHDGLQLFVFWASLIIFVYHL